MTVEEQITLDAIDALNAKCIDPAANNEVMLMVDIEAMRRAKNGGYPCHMYHATLPPRTAINRLQANNLIEAGYRKDVYIHQAYPKVIYRRNFNAKFKADDFVESRMVQNEGQEREALKSRPPAMCEAWVDDFHKLSPLPDEQREPAEVRIARLEGELQASRQKGQKAS